MTQQTLSCSEITWDQDYESRVNPGLMTSLLRASIPVLEQSDWKVQKSEMVIVRRCSR